MFVIYVISLFSTLFTFRYSHNRAINLSLVSFLSKNSGSLLIVFVSKLSYTSVFNTPKQYVNAIDQSETLNITRRSKEKWLKLIRATKYTSFKFFPSEVVASDVGATI